MKLFKVAVSTSIGWLTLTSTDSALTEISFGKKINQIYHSNEILRQAELELRQYLNGERTSFQVPYTLSSTEFRTKTWNSLCRIPYGELATYGEIAESIHQPTAARAVGRACNENPLPLVIPCHRVVGHSGNITGYAGGLEIKTKLIELERNNLIHSPKEMTPSRPFPHPPEDS